MDEPPTPCVVCYAIVVLLRPRSLRGPVSVLADPVSLDCIYLHCPLRHSTAVCLISMSFSDRGLPSHRSREPPVQPKSSSQLF